jgi:hypothetical protein
MIRSATSIGCVVTILATCQPNPPGRPVGQQLPAPSQETVPESTAVRTATKFMRKQPHVDEVRLDSLMIRADSLEWQVYFFLREPRVPPFALVAVSKRTGVARLVPLR